ncbi:MAG: phytanoyl-CoA dioxygenase family protein, partial [Crocosphaera sp.]
MVQAFKLLAKQGFLKPENLYSSNLIEEWNTLLDPYFLEQKNKDRSYVKSNTLMELGIINKIFNKQLKSLLCSLMPDAIFYHCHAYEISSSQIKSHIHWGENLGWHRDEECGPYYNSNQANHISMFIYLTNVDKENGPFEIRLKSPLSYLQLREKTLKVIGEAGTVFFFNRFFWHRACPNISAIRRRVIKLSFQPRKFENDRINLE